ncbi:hypothetical protein GCM10025882_15200 [Acinetobacter gyllenbergii]|uniref:SH3b domain-containing protein n=1 Tax=Acinetobacter gyllenbergii CIP 110306 = MTCC 11365 TaxID=1217657 RepID=A0A829HF14_9GAMM|nr:SH3 domain-containing protein [Acinetobacter gyllenbergii]EPF77304.1 hypothetical protein F957_02782 [Acinetobacter gyllenbergii CIP 110306 = MTCC 11365]EPH33233.1 hypothetical protein L293_0832 [Acinetobacter gyllenbergii CIP 110306 = MTCC 11365]GMA11095.1 hypothetical protein GCM10025882_15200 [Acinetobacter gyllenbergii]
MIPTNEINKLTMNPEWQRNIQAASKIASQFQSGLIKFLSNPEVQNAFKVAQEVAIKYNEVLNKPEVRNALVRYAKRIVEVAENKEFQEKYEQLSSEAVIEEDKKIILETMLTTELDSVFDFSELNFLSKNAQQIYTVLVCLVSLFANFYAIHTPEWNNASEAYIEYIQNIEGSGVTISRINLREAPHFKSESIIVIPRNTALKIYKEKVGDWVKVSFTKDNIELEGYVAEAYIKRIKNDETYETVRTILEEAFGE